MHVHPVHPPWVRHWSKDRVMYYISCASISTVCHGYLISSVYSICKISFFGGTRYGSLTDYRICRYIPAVSNTRYGRYRMVPRKK